MENASKALIIAGAILLSILLISLGIMIFSQAQDTVSNSGMKQAEITAFNNKFTKYEGIQKGSVVRAMVQEIIASNADDNNISANRIVYMMYTPKGGGERGMVSSSNIENSKSYDVSISTYYDTSKNVDNSTQYNNGCVKTIKIVEK